MGITSLYILLIYCSSTFVCALHQPLNTPRKSPRAKARPRVTRTPAVLRQSHPIHEMDPSTRLGVSGALLVSSGHNIR
ncbi:hypothetical protein EYF80_008652 [Liparis tanakae]|uniref:Secreted protein n=1 Tax=Liparis tanakae TaxID=230148 RepID=A0A4Z2IT18_9TELE|nr:hypothetical protein EYF80_008652 [Liparis tanakae]